MENRSHALAAGLFTVVLLAALTVAGAWLGRGGEEYGRVFLIESTKSVSGLNPKAVVRYRGVDVGRVERIGFAPDRPQVIQIRIVVSQEAHITTATYARLSSLGITGIAFVELDDDGKNGTPLTGYGDPVRLDLHASTLEEFGDAGQLLLVRINEIAQRLNYLLNEENQVRLGNSLASIERLTERFANFQDHLVPVIDRMPRLMDRGEAIARRTEDMLVEIEAATKETREHLRALETVRDTAAGVGHATDDLHERTLPALHRLADRVARASETLERALANTADQPESLLFGRTPPQPGPGEPGFAPGAEGEPR